MYSGGYLGYYGLSTEYQMAKTIACGLTGYISGFASGFTFSLNRYRISILEITTMNNQKFKITKPFNQTEIDNEVQNTKRLIEQLDMRWKG